MVSSMRTISVAVSEGDYEAFRESALTEGRSIAQLIREAMALYREQRLETRTRMIDIPILLGHLPVQDAALPSRQNLYEEVFDERSKETGERRALTVHEPEREHGDGSK